MKAIQNLHTRTLPLLATLFISACSGSGSNAPVSGDLSGANSTADETIERVTRSPEERGCIPINAEGNEALARDVFGFDLDTINLMDPDGAGALTPSSIAVYLQQNESRLGGRGVEATRGASISYFRATSQFSNYLCEAASREGHALLQNPEELAKVVWGGSLDAEEIADLQELEGAVSGSDNPKIASCTLILSALETQCIN